MVAEYNTALFAEFLPKLDFPLIRQKEVAIMIAFDEEDFGSDALSPVPHPVANLGGEPLLPMNEITEQDQTLDLVRFEYSFQPQEIILQDGAADWYARLLKYLRLAPMQIGDHQSSAFSPMDGFFREEREAFTLDFPLDRAHKFLILSIRSASCSDDI